ncbi:ATP-binding protein [Streptomyces cavernicola]|uniref:ATP-binding protein n=1 Tax=Streptomyces cavernicola TaxID=3043613 RepID=A0ABT6SDJ5_9ACTN|nr:ATP-binding protein [Streptomyces sp. B-S-A6]MDI3405356.1 ATP-binding protein [Streptomyces sp. B-S-A6]
MHQTNPQPQPTTAVHEFAMAFTATPRGARLARHLVSHRLDAWGHPYDDDVNETLTLLAGELCANAVRHGRVPGRDFHVRLTEEPGRLFRLEVSDTRTERRPAPVDPACPGPDAESGRGLLLVAALADAWGITDRRPAPGKTVWATLRCSPPDEIGISESAATVTAVERRVHQHHLHPRLLPQTRQMRMPSMALWWGFIECLTVLRCPLSCNNCLHCSA